MSASKAPAGARGAASAIGVALFAIALGARRLTDFDLPWHLASGRAIVLARGVPARDALTWSHAPLRYVDVASDVALYAIDRACGAIGLQIAGALARRGDRARAPRGDAEGRGRGRAVVWIALAALATWTIVRPQLLSFAFLAATFAAIEAHRASPSSARGASRCGHRPARSGVGNAHGTAPLGALVAIAYAAHRAIAARASSRFPSLFPRDDGARAGEAAIVAACAVAAACANRNGLAILAMTSRADADLAGVAEWARPSLAFFVDHEPLAIVVALAAIASLTFARDPATGARALPAFDLALAIAAAIGATLTIRDVPIAILVLAWVAGRRDASLRVPAKALGVASIALAFAPAAVVAVRAESLGAGFAPRHYPEGAAQWIEARAPRGPMWNFWPFGGWLEYRLAPRWLAMTDGRNTAANDASLVALGRASIDDPAALAAIVRDHDVQLAVTDASPDSTHGGPLASDPSRWAMVHMDDVAAVYARRDGPNASLADGGYRVLTHVAPPAVVLAASIAPGARAADLAHDGALAAAQDPESARAAFFDACGAIATRDEPRFDRAVARVAALAPRDAALVAALREGWARATRGNGLELTPQ